MTFRKAKCIWWSPGEWQPELQKQSSMGKLEYMCKALPTDVRPKRFEFSVLDFSALEDGSEGHVEKLEWGENHSRKQNVETLGINEEEIMDSRDPSNLCMH